jgi:PTS system cellobiose-specific IIC component
MEKKGFMNWMQTKMAPAMNKFASYRVIRSIMQGFWYAMPIIFVGIVFQVVGNIGLLALQNNPELLAKINVLKDLSYGLLGILFALGITQANAKALKIDPTAPTIFALIMYFLMISPEFIATDNMLVTLFQVNFSALGAQGMTIAILVGITSSEVCGLFQRKGWTIKAKGLPQFMQNWFLDFFPGVLLISITWAIVYLAGINVFSLIEKIFGPLIVATDTLPFLMILGILSALMFFMGIHPATIYVFVLPFMLSGAAENTALYNAGVAPLLSNGYHLATFGVFLTFMAVGGSGGTLGLNFLMLRSKSKAVRQLGKTAIVPSILNINEPIIFGCPIAFNPILGIGSILVQGIINPIIAYIVLTTGIVPPASTMTLVAFLPTPILALLLNMGISGAIVALLIWVVDAVVWTPFFKVYEKQMLDKEEAPAK